MEVVKTLLAVTSAVIAVVLFGDYLVHYWKTEQKRARANLWCAIGLSILFGIAFLYKPSAPHGSSPLPTIPEQKGVAVPKPAEQPTSAAQQAQITSSPSNNQVPSDTTKAIRESQQARVRASGDPSERSSRRTASAIKWDIVRPSGNGVAWKPPITITFPELPADRHVWLLLKGECDSVVYWPACRCVGQGGSAIVTEPTATSWESKVGGELQLGRQKEEEGMKYTIDLVAVGDRDNETLRKICLEGICKDPNWPGTAIPLNLKKGEGFSRTVRRSGQPTLSCR